MALGPGDVSKFRAGAVVNGAGGQMKLGDHSWHDGADQKHRHAIWISMCCISAAFTYSLLTATQGLEGLAEPETRKAPLHRQTQLWLQRYDWLLYRVPQTVTHLAAAFERSTEERGLAVFGLRQVSSPYRPGPRRLLNERWTRWRRVLG